MNDKIILEPIKDKLLPSTITDLFDESFKHYFESRFGKPDTILVWDKDETWVSKRDNVLAFHDNFIRYFILPVAKSSGVLNVLWTLSNTKSLLNALSMRPDLLEVLDLLITDSVFIRVEEFYHKTEQKSEEDVRQIIQHEKLLLQKPINQIFKGLYKKQIFLVDDRCEYCDIDTWNLMVEPEQCIRAPTFEEQQDERFIKQLAKQFQKRLKHND
ncbi:MAG: hypothetical protein HQM12_18095 [SAR324 cluster bacterium]|nr:hypothetical protein [SAR324 cluster bacterium]